jgi:alpha-galactosidase
MIQLENPFLSLSLDPSGGAWRLASREDPAFALDGARIAVEYRAGGRPVKWILAAPDAQPALSARTDRFHGRARTLRIAADAGHGLALQAEWILPAARPFLMWRVVLANRGADPLWIDAVDLCRAGPRFAAGGGLRLPVEPARRTMFVNGWQSWSFAGGRTAADRQPGPRLGPINSAMHAGTRRRSSGRPGHFVSDMFAAIGGGESADLLVAGFLSQREQFGFVETRLADAELSLCIEADADGVRLDPGKTLATDRAFLALGRRAATEEYLDAAARENGARAARAAPAGWSSWYYYYTNVTQADLEKNTAAAADLRGDLPLQLIQLDDGYQADVGDWLERNRKFPAPLAQTAAKIRKAGFTPGVWLSPFLVRMGSQTAGRHPDWLTGRARGVMSNASPAGVRETRSLDVTRPEVLAHVRGLIRTAVRGWKFPFLKLDFLYIPAVKGARLSDPTVTRARALRRALEAVRRAAGEKTFLLGCGCPLGSGIGIFDAMRIGPDVDSFWKPHLFHRVWAARGDPTVPAAWNAVRNAIARAPLHRRWWWNDPDCLLARDAETRLSPAERRSLAAAIALCGGMVLLSDDLAGLSPDALRLAQSLFPPLYRSAGFPHRRAQAASDLAALPLRGPQGDWWVVGVFNWEDRPLGRAVNLRELTGIRGRLAVASFWDADALSAEDGWLHLEKIPAHGVSLLAVRERRPGVQYLGSNLHYSQGIEIRGWEPRPTSLRAVLRLGRAARGWILLSIPRDPAGVRCNGENVRADAVRDGVWKIPVEFDREGIVEVRWSSKG